MTDDLAPQEPDDFASHADLSTEVVQLRVEQRAIRLSNYILYACVIVVAGLGLWRVTVLNHANHRLASEAHGIAQSTQALVLQGRRARQNTTFQVCRESDKLVGKLKTLLIQATEGSRPFSEELVKLGLPPYSVRLAAAKQEAASLTLTDCTALKP
jgi:hypothetical protein